MSSDAELARSMGIGEFAQGKEFGEKEVEEETPEEIEKQIKDEIAELKGLTCDICGFKTTHKIALIGHMASHKKGN